MDNGDHAIDASSYHAISEMNHRGPEPLVGVQARQPGGHPGDTAACRMLDLACGKGEMACQFAAAWLEVTGVDVYEALPSTSRDADRPRTRRRGPPPRFRASPKPAAYCRSSADAFDLACCIGATWIGGGLAGTVRAHRYPLPAAGSSWASASTTPAGTPPSADAPEGDLADVLTTLDRAELQLVEMVIVSPDDWDRYVASQWLNVEQWLQANPDDPRGAAVRAEARCQPTCLPRPRP